MNALRRRSMEDWIVYLLYSATVAIPLWPVLGTFLVIGTWCLSVLFQRQYWTQRLHWLQWVVLAYLVWTGLSVFASVNPAWSSMSWAYHIGVYGMMYWLMSIYMDRESRRRIFLRLFVLTGVVVCFVAAYQYIWIQSAHIHEWVDAAHFPTLMRRMYGTLQNPNLLGEYLLFLLSISGLGMLQAWRSRRWKLLGWMIPAIVFMLLCLVLTYSRGMWISLAISVALAGIFVERRLLYTLLIVPIVLYFYHGEVAGRLWSLFNGQDTSVMLRWALWDSTTYMIREFPFFGIGWDSFWMTYGDYNYFIQDPSVIIYHAHNVYLQVAAETGIPALVLFLVILLGHAIRIRHLKVQDLGITLRYGIFLVVINVLVSGLFDHALYSQQVGVILWQLLGLSMSIIRSAEIEPTSTRI